VRFLSLATLAIAIGFFCLLIGDTLNSTEWLDSRGVAPFARMTITTLRDMELTSGVSPSAPALLCMLCVYVWAVGRMQRLALAHSISRASPPDNETDLVSTPIRLILYPRRTSSDGEDAGFTKAERDLADAIWRPITGTVCVVAALGLAFFPLVLFALKPFSTLEGPLGSALLGAGLTLSVFLVGVTLVQQVQYWFSLERLLKRTLEHPLGAAFRGVPAFARDSLDHQVSRSPDELLRWSSCARQFHDLTRSLDTTGDFELLAGEKPALAATAANLCRARTAALAGRELGEVDAPADATESADTSESGDADASVSARDRSSLDAPESADVVPLSFPMRREQEAAQGRDEELRATLQALLAQEVIAAASRITELLERAWTARAVLQDQLSEAKEARISGQVEVSFAALAVAGIAGSRQLLPSGDGDSLPPRAVATVTGSSIPPSAPRARSAALRAEPAASGERTADALTPLEDSYSAAQLAWLRSAQTFVATVVTLIVHSHVRQFRHFVAVTTLCSLLLLLAVCSYPFEPHRLMLTLIWVVVLSVAGAGLWIFIQMDRNTLISHVSGTSPDEVTFDGSLLLRVFAWTVVPLLSVAAAQYPEFANILFRIVSPFARALH
jgi:hypothetical protein